MALPLLLLGAGIAALALENDYRSDHKSSARILPGESDVEVDAVDGALVCCGIYGMFEHSGIWCDDGLIELKGNGLIRHVTPDRCLHNRSGERLFIACDAQGRPLQSDTAKERACQHLFEYWPYDVLDNNCHRFSWYCISGRKEPLTRFMNLNSKVAGHFSESIHWHPVKARQY